MSNKNLIFSYTTKLPFFIKDVFAWHERDGAFERLNPCWAPVKIISSVKGIKDGAKVVVKVPYFGSLPFYMTWKLTHDSYSPPNLFRDVLTRGLFKSWKHSHKFSDLKLAVEGGDKNIKNLTLYEDSIEFELPFPMNLVFGSDAWRWVSELVQRCRTQAQRPAIQIKIPFLSSELNRVFKYRHQILLNDLQEHNGVVAKKIAISGASGFVGSALTPFLTTGGHTVTKLVRKMTDQKDECYWDQQTSTVDLNKLENLDVFIHLAGENIAEGKWTTAKKNAIRSSRVEATNFLVDRLLKLKNPPKIFISASAIGIYNSSKTETFDEDSEIGSGFLAEVASEWENATKKLSDHGVRVVNLRFGIVLSPNGGALKQMMLPFLCGLGGRLGDGMHYMSWIALEDLIRIIYYSINNEKLNGPINCVAPNPVTNAEFTKIFGKVLKRPTLIPTPIAPLRALYGEMVDAVLLASHRVLPKRLEEAGFKFNFPELEQALRFSLGK